MVELATVSSESRSHPELPHLQTASAARPTRSSGGRPAGREEATKTWLLRSDPETSFGSFAPLQSINFPLRLKSRDKTISTLRRGHQQRREKNMSACSSSVSQLKSALVLIDDTREPIRGGQMERLPLSFSFVASGSRKFVKMEKVSVCHV